MTQWVDLHSLQFVDEEQQWLDSAIDVSFKNVFIDETYYYNTVNTTLQIYLIETETLINSVNYTQSIICMWSNTSYLFLGTSEGVLRINKDNFLAQDLMSLTETYKFYPEITGNNIIDIHGTDQCVAFCTNSGVDFFNLIGYEEHSYIETDDVTHCHIISNRDMYYSTDHHIYHVNPVPPVFYPDIIFSAGSGILTGCSQIDDFKVTLKNGTHNYFIQTDLGIYAIEESGAHKVIDSYTDIIKLDVNKDTTINSEKLYITTTNAFSVIDMHTLTLFDQYTYTSKGRSGDTLDYEIIEDSDIN
jgi:hypothetical protein